MNREGVKSEVIVCGGGVFNKVLMYNLSNVLSDYVVIDSYVLGIYL